MMKRLMNRAAGIYGFLTGSVVLLLLDSAKKNRSMQVLREEVDYYKNLAFVDTLTGLPNRTAYDREVSRIEANPQAYGSLTCIIFDLNYLKITNDTFGHLAGDELIRGSGECIQKTFQSRGLFFRLGGDEFAVILQDRSEAEVARLADLLCKNIADYNNTHEFKIDISWGIAMENEEPNIRRLLKQADARMYENKKRNKLLQ